MAEVPRVHGEAPGGGRRHTHCAAARWCAASCPSSPSAHLFCGMCGLVVDVRVGLLEWGRGEGVRRAHPHAHAHTHGEPCGFLGAGWRPENCAVGDRMGDGALRRRSCGEEGLAEGDGDKGWGGPGAPEVESSGARGVGTACSGVSRHARFPRRAAGVGDGRWSGWVGVGSRRRGKTSTGGRLDSPSCISVVGWR